MLSVLKHKTPTQIFTPRINTSHTGCHNQFLLVQKHISKHPNLGYRWRLPLKKGGLSQRTPLYVDSSPRILDSSFLLGLESKLILPQKKKRSHKLSYAHLSDVLDRNALYFLQTEMLKGNEIKMKLHIKAEHFKWKKPDYSAKLSCKRSFALGVVWSQVTKMGR